MWIKLLYFMRIFKNTGYLVKILTECISDMRVFLFIYLTMIVAFNEAFMRLSDASIPMGGNFNGMNYAEGFAWTFALSIGDTRTDNYDVSISPAVVWIIFCLVLLIMNVVCLNLMVAIISKSFEEINENWERTMYQERACIISENGYLIPWSRKQELCLNANKYLVVARELLDEDNDKTVVQEVQNKINEIDGNLKALKTEFRDRIDEMGDKIVTQI